MATPAPSTVQFPTEDDGIDCPEALEDDESGGGASSQAPPLLANGDGHGDGPLGIPGKGPSTSEEQAAARGRETGNDCGSSDEEDDDYADPDGIDDWKLDDGAGILCDCLICDYKTVGYDAADNMMSHIEEKHALSFSKLKSTFCMNYPSFVQFVRWAREQKLQGKIDQAMRTIWEIRPSNAPWFAEKYLLPPAKATGDDEDKIDYFLTLDFFASEEIGPNEAGPALNSFSVEELVAQIEKLKVDKQHMTEVFQRILGEGKAMGGGCAKLYSKKKTNDAFTKDYINRRFLNLGDVDSDGNKRIRIAMDGYSNDTVGACSSNNELYFDSYNEIGIHHEMIFDRARTEAYRLAIAERANDIKGKYVMDVGCGTGILSMFCAQHDPKMVYAVEKSDIIYDAMSNSFENNFHSKIQFCHNDIDKDEMKFAAGKVDVLVSEFMGYFLFFEGMTETFLRARDKFLAPGGILLPDACSVELVPLGSSGLYKSKVQCWNNAYGFKMPALQTRVLNETMIELVKPDEIIGHAVRVKELDLRTCQVSDIKIDNVKFTFEFTKDDEFTAIAGYFLVNFEGINNKVVLSTSPREPATHWKQAVFFLPRHTSVKAGEKIHGAISSHPHHENPRWLVIIITVGDLTQKYEFR